MIDKINRLIGAFSTPMVKNVYLVGYADLPRDQDNNLCTGLSGDISMFDLSQTESSWISQRVIKGLNDALRDAVTRANLPDARHPSFAGPTKWHFVDVVGPFTGHGICADFGRFVNTPLDSKATHSNGPLDQDELVHSFAGTAHPNDSGYDAIATAISNAVAPVVLPPVPPRVYKPQLSDTEIAVDWDDAGEGTDRYDASYFLNGNKTGPISVFWDQRRRLSIPNPQPGQTYSVEVSSCKDTVKAQNLDGCSAPTYVTIVVPQRPAAPSDLAVSSERVRSRFGFDIQYKFSWRDNSTNETLFELQAQDLSGNWARIWTTPANIKSVTLSSELAYGVAFRVRACNGLCSAFSKVVVPMP